MRYAWILSLLLLSSCKNKLPPVEDGRCRILEYRTDDSYGNRVECIYDGFVWNCIEGHNCTIVGNAPAETEDKR